LPTTVLDKIVLLNEQQYTPTTADHKLREIYKVSEEFNLLHKAVCDPTGGLLRGLLEEKQ
jgi:hypothetical protein